MARAKGGVLGSISGKFGSVVGYRLRGTDVIRGLPRITKKKPSMKQLAHRERFKLIQQWRSFLTPIFAITFKIIPTSVLHKMRHIASTPKL